MRGVTIGEPGSTASDHQFSMGSAPMGSPAGGPVGDPGRGGGTMKPTPYYLLLRFFTTFDAYFLVNLLSFPQTFPILLLLFCRISPIPRTFLGEFWSFFASNLLHVSHVLPLLQGTLPVRQGELPTVSLLWSFFLQK